MSMLGQQANELRLMARLVRDYDYKEISRMLREAADTIISLRDRLQDAELGLGTCKLELATDMESIRCSVCGYKLPKGTDLKATKFCGGCGCEVER